MNPVETGRSRWRMVAEMLSRPYPLRPRVLVPMITLLALVPGYLVIAELTDGRSLHVPELAVAVEIAGGVLYAQAYAGPGVDLTPFLAAILSTLGAGS